MLTTRLGMQYLCVILLIGTPICSLGKKVLHDPCKINSDCGENQICVHKKCSCESESFVWHGKYCLKAKKFGDICKDQSECSKSGDPFLHCLSTKDGSERCLCSNGYDLVGDKCTKKEFHVNKMKPLPTPHKSKTLSYPPLNIYAAPEAQHHEDIHGIHVSDTVEGTSVDLTAWIGPMIVTLMALIVIIVCCCFLRIDPSAPHSEEIDAFRRAREAKYAHGENGMDEIAMEHGNIGSSIGIDNEGFNYENADTISAYTANTEFSDIEEDCKKKEEKGPNKNSHQSTRFNFGEES